MNTYNYNEAVKADVKEYIQNNYTTEEITEGLAEREEFDQKLYDEMWTADQVTGNGSGSYTFNRWQAEENLCHNMNLLADALEDFGCGLGYIEKGAEACDVTIRCYLLGSALAEVLDEFEELYNEESEG